MSLIALDDFAGTGWGVACKWLGINEAGVELMPEAVATREANGMVTIGRDVWAHVSQQRDAWNTDRYRYSLYIASPPCQTFSMAGSGSGRKALDEVIGLIDARAYLDVERLHEFGERHDPRTALVLAPLVRIVHDAPVYIVLEQVPPVLPVWQRYAVELREWGYSVWCGILNAEQYGVPQTRRRAVLIARADGIPAAPPLPTHSRYYPTNKTKLDEGVLPWVSMAQALEWGMMERPYFTIAGGANDGSPGGHTGGQDPAMLGGSGARKALAQERESGRWLVANDKLAHSASGSQSEPAPTITGGHDSGNRVWAYNRPATTVVGSFGPDIISAPGGSGTRPSDVSAHRQDRPGSIKVTAREAAALQSYPSEFDWETGINGKPQAMGKQFLQIGNAVPPLLARAILGVFL